MKGAHVFDVVFAFLFAGVNSDLRNQSIKFAYTRFEFLHATYCEVNEGQIESPYFVPALQRLSFL